MLRRSALVGVASIATALKTVEKKDATFWNKLKSFLKSFDGGFAYAYHPMDDRKHHWHFIIEHTAVGRFVNLSCYRSLRRMAADLDMEFWSREIKSDEQSMTRSLAYLFKTPKVYMGATTKALVGEIYANVLPSVNELVKTMDDMCDMNIKSSILEDNDDDPSDLLVDRYIDAEDDMSVYGLTPAMLPSLEIGSEGQEVYEMDLLPPLGELVGEGILPPLKRNRAPEPLSSSAKRQCTHIGSKFDYGDFANKMVLQLVTFMNEYKVYDYQGLLIAMAKADDNDNMQQLITMHAKSVFTKCFDDASTLVEVSGRTTYMDDIISTNSLDYTDMTNDETYALFQDWAEEQGINHAAFLFKLWVVIAMRKPKINCFLMWGKSNAGKTFWMEYGVGYLSEKVGRPNAQAQFMWSECAKSNLIIMNETQLLSQVEIDSFKCIAGGEEFVTPKKYGQPLRITRQPVLYTSNEAPWSRASGEHSTAMKNRCYITRLHKHSQVLADFALERPNTRPNPRMFAVVFEYLNSKFISDELIDNAFQSGLDPEEIGLDGLFNAPTAAELASISSGQEELRF